MALAHFQRTFTDTQGNVKPGLAVTVRRESDNGLAALFADAGSVTAKSNPFNTDANGYGSFYVTDGRYRIQATDIDWRDEDLISQPSPNFSAMPQVGGDPIVDGRQAVNDHVALPDPHSQYTKTTDLATVATSGSYGDLSGIADDLELKRYNETVATGSATLDRADGGIQTFTMTVSITLAVTIAAGESLTFHLSAGDTYAVTWPTMTWVGGSAPTLTADDVIEFWKIGSTLYGAYVGAV
jgi:hypothetical protein